MLSHKSTAAPMDGNTPSGENSPSASPVASHAFSACPCAQDQTEDPQARREPSGHVPVETLVP